MDRLIGLNVFTTKVADFSPLKDTPNLKFLWCDFEEKRDAALLRSVKSLEFINDKPVAVFWQELDRKRAGKKPATVEEAMAEGRKNFDRNHFDRAAENYAQAIALDPTKAEAFAMRGRCKIQSGDFQKSIADFSKAIDLDPKNADFCKHRASAYGLLRQFDPAIADGEQSLKLRPADPGPVKDLLARLYSNRAAAHAGAERYAEAAEDVTQAMRHDPKAAVFYHQRGSCYFNLKQFEKAAADFAGAIEREPTKASHYTNRGMCWQAVGDEKKAAADFETAKKLGEK